MTIQNPVAGTFAELNTVRKTARVTATRVTGGAGQEEEPAPTINGVTAQGTRTTLTIPLGQIGNDRPIEVISERWFSTDLEMTVKSSNSDPRFGETTYQLTGISQAAQDPGYFWCHRITPRCGPGSGARRAYGFLHISTGRRGFSLKKP